MRFTSYQAAMLAVMAVFVWGHPVKHADTAHDPLKNAPQLSLPLTDKKWVIAHCMTNIIRYKGHKLEDSCNPEYYTPEGNASAPLGGLTQVNVIADKYLEHASIDEAVEFEMRSAIQTGIDGFQFYYTLGNDSWDEIIKAYFRVAKAKKIDFKFTFCISHPSGGNEQTRIQAFAQRMNSILDEAGRNDPHWLRTPDGRLILYMWYGETLADIPENLNNKTAQYYIANAYKKLGEAVKEEFACVYSINEQISTEKLNNCLDYFPAVWIWTLPFNNRYIGKSIAQECKKRKRVFTGSAFNDFYTSKLLKKGTWDMFHYVNDAVNTGLAGTERKYIVTGLSYNFRQLLEFGISQDVPIMNIITWNDYPEGHHLAPEVNHNDGFGVLLQHYKNKWQQKEPAYKDRDVVVAFYKKYRHSIHPSPFDVKVVEIEKPGIPVQVEDSIEVVTILKEAAQLIVKDQTVQVSQGLQSTRFAASPGKVTVTIMRKNNPVLQVNCPEWITDKPYRTDRLTYSYSSESERFYKKIFGDFPVVQSTEYDPASADNRISVYHDQSVR